MAEQRYLYGDPCFKVRQREGVRRWLCETCGGPRDEHLVLIVEEPSRRLAATRPDHSDVPRWAGEWAGPPAL